MLFIVSNCNYCTVVSKDHKNNGTCIVSVLTQCSYQSTQHIYKYMNLFIQSLRKLKQNNSTVCQVLNTGCFVLHSQLLQKTINTKIKQNSSMVMSRSLIKTLFEVLTGNSSSHIWWLSYQGHNVHAKTGRILQENYTRKHKYLVHYDFTMHATLPNFRGNANNITILSQHYNNSKLSNLR